MDGGHGQWTLRVRRLEMSDLKHQKSPRSRQKDALFSPQSCLRQAKEAEKSKVEKSAGLAEP